MHGRSLTFLSFVACAAALVACACGFLLFRDVASKLEAHASALSRSSAESAQQESVARINAAATDTAAARGALEALFSTDVVGIANQIQSAGESAGASTKIGTASIVTVPNLPSGITALQFLVQSQGSFSQVVHAAEFFETLPLPSKLGDLDFVYAPPQGKTPGFWRLNASLEVITSANVSS